MYDRTRIAATWWAFFGELLADFDERLIPLDDDLDDPSPESWNRDLIGRPERFH